MLEYISKGDVMGKILFEVFISVMAVYGIIALVSEIISSLRYRVRTKNSGVKLILAVKDQENAIEGIIRGIYSGGLLERTIGVGNLTVVDMGSQDDTVKILMRLQKSCQGLEIAQSQDMESILDDFRRSDAVSRQ